MSSTYKTVRLKVSTPVARIAAEGAPRESRLQAARGALPLSPEDQVCALFFLAHGSDSEIKAAALKTLQSLDSAVLSAVASRSDLHPKLLDFMARVRLRDREVMSALANHPGFPPATLRQVAAHARGEVLELFADLARWAEKDPELLEVLKSNPHLSGEFRSRLEAFASGEEAGETPDADSAEEEDEENKSKYQRALEMGVSEKIKMALTGDKEWRSLFLKDSNKLVSAAVLKNPRITDGEVLLVIKNKSSSEELIRLITLNNEWVKNTEIKRALVYHPKTPLPKALRYMSVLTEKDLKHLAKSRGVSQVLVNNARRIITAKQKNR